MEEITPIEDNNINSIINLNENNAGGFATGIDYIGERKPSKEVILPPIKKQTPPKEEPEIKSVFRNKYMRKNLLCHSRFPKTDCSGFATVSHQDQ